MPDGASRYLFFSHASTKVDSHSLAYVILLRLGGFPSASSSSPIFFFLLPVAVLFAPFDVGWLDSRVGNEEVGVGACDGVVPAEPGVEASCEESVLWLYSDTARVRHPRPTSQTIPP